MKLLIASDIHGSAYYCKKLLEAFDKEKADKLVLLGDLLYHGPRNDLPKEYAPKEVLSMLNDRKESILCVRGNCDGDVDQMVLEFPILAEYAILFVGDKMVYATHGHKINTSALPLLQKGDILLYGHTHIPAWETFGVDNRYFNPGSVSIPKEGSEHGYMIIEATNVTWKNLDGEVYHVESL